MSRPPIKLADTRAARGDRDAVACLRALLVDIESGEMRKPSEVAIVVLMGNGDETDIQVYYSGARDVGIIGTLELGKLHVWQRTVVDGAD